MSAAVSASAVTKATPEVASARILSAEGLGRWWLGPVKVERVDAEWPAVGTRLRWRAGGGVFDAQVLENALPRRLVMDVHTPSADSRVTHRFEPAGSGTRYEKTVEAYARGALGRAFMPVMRLMLRSFVAREVRRAAAWADAAESG